MAHNRMFRAALLAVAMVGVTACSTNSAPPEGTSRSLPLTTVTAAPTTPATTAASSSTSGSSSPEPSASASTPSTPVDPEVSDREAIQAAWAGYWAANESLELVPELERRARLETYAADPILSETLATSEEWSKQGWVAYGQPVSRITWPTPVGGADTAVMSDCADFSGVGSMVAETGKKLTKGGEADNTQVTAQRGADGIWRISQIDYYPDVECTP